MQTTMKNSAMDRTLPLASIGSRHVPRAPFETERSAIEVASLMPALHRGLHWQRNER